MQPICATFGMQSALQPPDAERCIRPHAVSTHRAEATSCVLFPGGGGKRSPGSHRASEFLWHESALRDRRGRDQQVVGAPELAQTLTPPGGEGSCGSPAGGAFATLSAQGGQRSVRMSSSPAEAEVFLVSQGSPEAPRPEPWDFTGQ